MTNSKNSKLEFYNRCCWETGIKTEDNACEVCAYRENCYRQNEEADELFKWSSGEEKENG